MCLRTWKVIAERAGWALLEARSFSRVKGRCRVQFHAQYSSVSLEGSTLRCSPQGCWWLDHVTASAQRRQVGSLSQVPLHGVVFLLAQARRQAPQREGA